MGTPPAGSNTPAARGTAPVAAPPERLRTLAELPDDLRRSVPQLAFGGSVYSDTPAQRMVILNGQVMREGDAVTDELQIEQIKPRNAVLMACTTMRAGRDAHEKNATGARPVRCGHRVQCSVGGSAALEVAGAV
jgi:hypothetical protein